jgi:LPS-assembly lipoprotein
MSWSRRGLLLSVAAAAGCGFSPALAPEGSAAGFRGEFEISAPQTPSGFFLTRRLQNRLGLPASPRYRLSLQITEGAQVTGIPANLIPTRVNLLGQVDYDVVDVASGQVVHHGRVQSFSGYSSTSTTAATRAAQVDASKRLMTILADRVVADLLATSGSWRQ